MRNYIIRRFLLMIPTLLLVSMIIFLIVRLVPGDVIDAMAAEWGDVGDIDRAMIEKALGLDVPIFVQYGRWLGVVPRGDGSFSGIFQGDFGKSLWTTKTVTKLLSQRLPVTIELGLMGLIIAQLIALPIGLISALRQDSWGDYLGRSFAIICIAVPGFWLATMAIVFPSIWWGWSPPIMLIRFSDDMLGNLGMFIVPAIMLGMSMSGVTMRMTRTMMLEVLRQDYIRTAWSKGLKERIVIIRHALRNALIPVVTIVGLQVPIMVGGTVIIEQIFNLPGVGRLMVDATIKRDYPVISGVMFILGAIILLNNLVVDLTYGVLEPRTRLD